MPTETTGLHPYQVGYRDRCKGAVAWDNPYPDDTWPRHAWQSGWEQCSVHVEQDRIEGRTVELREAENE